MLKKEEGVIEIYFFGSVRFNNKPVIIYYYVNAGFVNTRTSRYCPLFVWADIRIKPSLFTALLSIKKQIHPKKCICSIKIKPVTRHRAWNTPIYSNLI